MTNLPQRKRVAAERLGKRAEWFAAAALMLKGYRIINWRYKTKLGEIDLIAKKGQLIAVVEVKARNSINEAVDAITWESQERIRNAADVWTSRQRNANDLSIRFDIIAVCPWQWPTHLKDAF